MELHDGGDGFRGQEHRVRGPVVARRRSRQDRTRAEDAPDRPGDHFVFDPGASDRAASGNRLRSCHRQTVDWRPPGVGRALAAKCHRRHARADAGLPARARPRPPASGMVQLGEAIRGLADPAAEGGRIVPAAVESRKQRSRGADGNDELLSRAAARHDDRRNGRSEISSRRPSARPNTFGRTWERAGFSSEAPATIRISPTKRPGC